jgi:glycosyltransferase involved in cell wall biosynthesis
LNWRKLRKLLTRDGAQLALNRRLRSLAQKHLSVPINVLSDYDFVFNENCPPCLPVRQTDRLQINWLVQGIAKAHGGLFNIYRTIQQLEAWGHENHVYVLGGLEEGSDEAARLVRRNYFDVRAKIELISSHIKDSDALIATSWPTAYAARRIANTVEKFYFVQDLEYMFYAPGSVSEMAKQTYQFGFRGITAGTWIADVLKKDFDMECLPFGFSYDRDQYGSSGDRLLSSQRKRVLFYARPETERRGFELGVLTLSLVAARLPEVEFVMVGFSPGSLKLPFPVLYPGVLPVGSLGALYRSCDVALVLSHTNLSLLPLELMACGCAVVSNLGPNTEWLLNHRISCLAAPDPKSLANAITEVLVSDELRSGLVGAALAFVSSTDWIKEIRKIESALLAPQRDSRFSSPHVQ